jgi:hypothetical protein
MKTNSKFKVSVLVVAVALFPLFASEKASAQNVTGFLSQTGTGLTTFTINLGETFLLDLNTTATFSQLGISYWYQTGANGSGLFSLMTRTTTGSPYPDPVAPDSVIFRPDLLHPVNNNDLGATCNTCPIAPGSYFMSTYTFSTTAGVGTYTIFLDSRGSVADDQFNDHVLHANTITVTIVPAPAKTRSH